MKNIILFGFVALNFFVSVYDDSCKLRGIVIKVKDGDSIIVIDHFKKQHEIRLAGVDAPEYRQPFSKKSKIYLSKLIMKKQVCVNWYKVDIYNRKVGKVLLNKADVNLKLIDKGLAWHYKRFQKEQTKEDRKKYAESEIDARLATIGIWSRPDYIAPWKWRKGARPRKISRQEKRRIIDAKRRNKSLNKGDFNCGTKRFCGEMRSCSEARFYLTECGLRRLDGDHDSIPCESICGHY